MTASVRFRMVCYFNSYSSIGVKMEESERCELPYFNSYSNIGVKMAGSEGLEPPWYNDLRCLQNSLLMTAWITPHDASLIGYSTREAICCQ